MREVVARHHASRVRDTWSMQKKLRSPASTEERLQTAIHIAALIIQRFEGGEFEADAIRIFERVETAFLELRAREDAKARAAMLLAKTSGMTGHSKAGKHLGKHFDKHAKACAPKRLYLSEY